MSKQLQVIVTIREDYLDAFDPVVDALQAAGLEVDDVLDFIGQVTGRCAADGLSLLQAVDGVDFVEESGDVSI